MRVQGVACVGRARLLRCGLCCIQLADTLLDPSGTDVAPHSDAYMVRAIVWARHVKFLSSFAGDQGQHNPELATIVVFLLRSDRASHDLHVSTSRRSPQPGAMPIDNEPWLDPRSRSTIPAASVGL
jgi:hypothetical protein